MYSFWRVLISTLDPLIRVQIEQGKVKTSFIHNMKDDPTRCLVAQHFQAQQDLSRSDIPIRATRFWGNFCDVVVQLAVRSASAVRPVKQP